MSWTSDPSMDIRHFSLAWFIFLRPFFFIYYICIKKYLALHTRINVAGSKVSSRIASFVVGNHTIYSPCCFLDSNSMHCARYLPSMIYLSYTTLFIYLHLKVSGITHQRRQYNGLHMVSNRIPSSVVGNHTIYKPYCFSDSNCMHCTLDS